MTIILLACGLGVVIVNCYGHVVFFVELSVQRRLCPIFMSGDGYPTSTNIPWVDELSRRQLGFGVSHN